MIRCGLLVSDVSLLAFTHVSTQAVRVATFHLNRPVLVEFLDRHPPGTILASAHVAGGIQYVLRGMSHGSRGLTLSSIILDHFALATEVAGESFR